MDPEDDIPDPEDLPDDEAEENEGQDEGTGQDGEGGLDAGDDAQDAEGGQGQEARQNVAGRPAGRSNTTISRLRAENREHRLRLEELQRQVSTLRAPPPPDPAVLARQQQEEAERFALLDPAQQFQYMANRQNHLVSSQMVQMQRQMEANMDKIAFEGRLARDPIARKYAPEVERLVAEQAAQGFTVKRETLLAYAVGQAVLAKAGKVTMKARQGAAGRTAANTVSPNRGANADLGGSRRERGGADDLAALEKRLANQVF